jgi:magnesium-transporting ATPase (P-type)
MLTNWFLSFLRKETAIAVAREIELLPPVDEFKSAEEQDNDLPPYSVLTSTDLHRMSDEELSTHLHRIRVIARALPTDKSRLVRIAQSNCGTHINHLILFHVKLLIVLSN